jgi:hypothetical protein
VRRIGVSCGVGYRSHPFPPRLHTDGSRPRRPAHRGLLRIRRGTCDSSADDYGCERGAAGPPLVAWTCATHARCAGSSGSYATATTSSRLHRGALPAVASCAHSGRAAARRTRPPSSRRRIPPRRVGRRVTRGPPSVALAVPEPW